MIITKLTLNTNQRYNAEKNETMSKETARRFYSNIDKKVNIKSIRSIVFGLKKDEPINNISCIHSIEESHKQNKSITNSKTKKKKISNLDNQGWASFNSLYNVDYSHPSIGDMGKVNHFFNASRVEYEWSVSSFDQIPSEKVKDKLKSESVTSVENTKSNHKLYQGRTGIPFDLINRLPEVAFLGRSNAGKSTLLNNLITESMKKDLYAFAKVSKKAGFTKTLNSFNVGNKFRLIDTPGYGFGSTTVQGNLSMEYIQNRDELLRCFILISANHGFTDTDLQIISFLKSIGRPFDIVFTKMDKINNPETIKNTIASARDHFSESMPRLIFTNSFLTKTCRKRYGIDLLRYSIFESCGIPFDSKVKRKKNLS